METENMTPDSLRQRILSPSQFLKMMALIIIGFSIYSCASLNSTKYQTRIRAVNKVKDQNTLYKVALEDTSYEVKIAAFNKITDQNLINRLAIESKEPELRLEAVNKVTDQNILYKVALDDDDVSVTGVALGKLSQGLLAKLTTESKEVTLRLRAIYYLSDQIELMSISQNNDEWVVRKAAFMQLNDNSLDILTREAKDPALILSANIRLKRISWSDAFSGTGSSTGKLGDVIGAAGLVDFPQPTSSDVVSACHKYIRQGDASRIPELINLLNRFGDVTLAEDYMNCGESTLSDAGCAWGRAHGYSCTTGFGSNRVRWGSGKK
jgi:hypothetical protein